MRFNVYSLIYAALLTVGSSLLAYSAVATPTASRIASRITSHKLSRNPSAMIRVHLLENLDAKDLNKVMSILKDRGFNPVRSPIFSESDTAIVVTQAKATETEPASIKVEMVKKEDYKIPVTLSKKIKSTANLQEVAELLPEDPSALLKETALAEAASLK